MEWVKAIHVIGVISWMAGLLYLPRLFVYHCDAQIGSEQSETFKVMERRLLRAIMTPAMIVSWGFGLWLLFGFQLIATDDFWAWGKGFAVILLTASHFFYAFCQKKFAQDRNGFDQRFFRFANEVPTLLMIVIVILVIVKPF